LLSLGVDGNGFYCVNSLIYKGCFIAVYCLYPKKPKAAGKVEYSLYVSLRIRKKLG